MPLQITTEDGGRILVVHVTGVLSGKDYEQMIPEVDRLLAQHKQINVLFHLQDFHGWTTAAMWEDTKFGVRHYHDIHRLAVVGQKAWHKGITMLAKPFTRASVKYFEESEYQQAVEWLHEPHPVEL